MLRCLYCVVRDKWFEMLCVRFQGSEESYNGGIAGGGGGAGGGRASMSDLSLHDVDDVTNNNNSSTSGGGGGPNSSSNGSGGAGSGVGAGGNREMTKAELEQVAFEALEKAYVSQSLYNISFSVEH